MVFSTLLLTYLIFLGGFLCTQSQRVFMKLPDGEIMGLLETTASDTYYFSFRGIPYAKPPIDDLRYQAPQTVDPWTETVDATKDKSICYQVPIDNDAESEDCLLLNVFVPRDSSADSPLPVMVFIHGGGFIQGSGSSENYGPQHFMDYDVILVTFNYRLGPFGFFSTGDDEIPGNAGLKDQNMVLHWVKKNIKHFGGDPEKVTIFGQGAGAASVVYHILSPMSKGLFRAAICESGSALNPWAYQRDQVDYTFQTAGIINPLFERNNMSSSSLREFATYIMASVIDQGSYKLNEMESPDKMQLQQGPFYGPVIEHDHEGAFLTQRMYEDLKNGNFSNIPLIIGINSNEAFDIYDNDHFNAIAQAFDKNVSVLVPLDLNVEDEETIQIIGTAIKNFYSPLHDFVGSNFNVIEVFNDNSFFRGIRKHAEFHSNISDVYMYQFAYSGPMGGKETKSLEGFTYRVRHGEELGYLFVRNYEKYNTSDLAQFSTMDVLVHKRFITMFTNFAKTLNPTPEEIELLENIVWPTLNLTNFQYLDIGSELAVKNELREYKYKDWVNLYNEYGVPPYDTY